MASKVPRWETMIIEATAEEKYPTVQFATVDENLIPRVRSLTFREFIINPQTPSLPLLTFSTDIRSPKIAQILAHPKAEVLWWIEDKNYQFRIVGDVYVCPDPAHPLFAKFKKDVENAKPGTGLALIKAGDLEHRRLELFAVLPPPIRAIMCKPPAGTRRPVDEAEQKGLPETLTEPGANSDEATKKNWDMALGNFTLIVLDPLEVELLDLSGNFQRTRFWKKLEDEIYVWGEEKLY